MKTCKQCEHYEFYDGPERNQDGAKAIALCSKWLEVGGHGYHARLNVCSKYFTPKKPVEKSCETCRLSRKQEGGCPKIGTITCGTIGSFQAWQPLKPDKPKAEVPEKENGGFIGCYDIKERRRSDVERERRIDKIIIDAINPPIPKEKAMPPKESCLNCNQRKRRIFGFWCERFKDRFCENSPCTGHKFKKTNPPNSKEKTMRMKKLIRKYVMGCTFYCTAVICVALDPWVCKFWYWIAPVPESETLSNTDIADKGMCWVFTLLSIAVVVLVIHIFNYITAYVFGKLEK